MSQKTATREDVEKCTTKRAKNPTLNISDIRVRIKYYTVRVRGYFSEKDFHSMMMERS